MRKRGLDASGGLFLALTWAGALWTAVVSGAPWILHIRRLLDVPYVLVLLVNFVPAMLAFAALFVMLRRDLRRALAVVMRLKGLLWFIGTWLVVDVLTALNTAVPFMDFIRLAWFPLMSLSFAILGLVASRDERIPLVTALCSSAVGAIGGALGYAAHAGVDLAPIAAYSNAALKLGAWAPAAGERFRAVGFDTDPNYYALLGVIVLAISLPHKGDVLLRVMAAISASTVVLLSGSRMGVLAVLMVFVGWTLRVLVNRKGRVSDLRAGVPVIAGVLVIVALSLAGAVVTRSSATVTDRLVQSMPAATDSASAVTALDSLSGARVSKWAQAFELYLRQPLGSFVPTGDLLGFSTHNQYLDNLIQGGPLYLIAYVAFIIWLGTLRPRGSSAAGVTLAIAYAATSMVLTTSYMAEVISMFFFLTGWMAGRSGHESVHVESRDEVASSDAAVPELRAS